MGTLAKVWDHKLEILGASKDKLGNKWTQKKVKWGK